MASNLLNDPAYFRCETYRCVMMKRHCMENQDKAALAGTPRGRYDTQAQDRKLGCSECTQGKAVRAEWEKGGSKMEQNATLGADNSTEIGAKACKACGYTKPLDAFPVKRECKDGHEGTCKECRTAQQQAVRTAKKKATRSGKAPGNGGGSIEVMTPPNISEQLARLVDDHWEYIRKLLEAHGVEGSVDLIEFHYKSAFVHGYKHGVEAGVPA